MQYISGVNTHRPSSHDAGQREKQWMRKEVAKASLSQVRQQAFLFNGLAISL